MKRKISGFHQDEESHWVADLICGRSQHTRHKPPLSVREGVLTPEGRESRIGSELDCTRCDQREIPERAQQISRSKFGFGSTCGTEITEFQRLTSYRMGLH